MSGYLIDLFFSLKGRATRMEWLLGSTFLVAFTLGGILLFNDGSFDESVNAAPEIPTMAAVLWALLCLYAFIALSAKRLNSVGSPLWATGLLVLAGLIMLSGWGAGYFLAPFTSRPDSLVFWSLIAATVPAVVIATGGSEST